MQVLGFVCVVVVVVVGWQESVMRAGVCMLVIALQL
jgi:hypothetical protein